MFSFVKKLCADTLQECLMMKKQNANNSTPYVKQSIQPNDDERKNMANTLDQDDNLDQDQDDAEFSTQWTNNPSSSSNQMQIAYETLHIEPVTANDERSKSANFKVEKLEKQEQDTKKKVVKMIGKIEEDSIVSKKQDLLDDEPNYFEEISMQKEQQITFNQAQIVKKNDIKYEQDNVEKSRFNDDVLEDFNMNGWVDDIEIEL